MSLSRFTMTCRRTQPADGVARRLDKEKSRDIARIYGGCRHWL